MEQYFHKSMWVSRNC